MHFSWVRARGRLNDLLTLVCPLNVGARSITTTRCVASGSTPATYDKCILTNRIIGVSRPTLQSLNIGLISILEAVFRFIAIIDLLCILRVEFDFVVESHAVGRGAEVRVLRGLLDLVHFIVTFVLDSWK